MEKKWAHADFNFEKIKNSNDLSDFLHYRALEHNNYNHYSNLKAIDGIVSSKSFRLMPSVNSNDTKDHNADIFNLCFATGDSESMPLWYFYGGPDGQGARLTFTKSQFNNLFNKASYKLVIGEDNKTVLEIPKDKVKISDVIYYKESDTVRLKYSNNNLFYDNKKNNNKTEKGREIIKNFLSENKNSSKGLIWFYEKETRISVDLNDLDELTDKQLSDIKTNIEKHKVVMSIHEDVLKKVTLRVGPSISDIDKIILKHQGIKDWLSSRIDLSTYHGTIGFDLKCKKCEHKSLDDK